MKHTGSRKDYNELRDRQLFLSFRNIIITSPDIHFADIARIVVTMPTSRFWVSEGRASIVISAMLKGQNPLARMNNTRRQMYQEIFRRVTLLLEQDAHLTLTKAVCRVVASPAPQFYLTPSSARIIYYRVKTRILAAHIQQVRHKAAVIAALRHND